MRLRSISFLALSILAAPAFAAQHLDAGDWSVWKGRSFATQQIECHATAKDSNASLTLANNTVEWAIFPQARARSLDVYTSQGLQDRRGASQYELEQGVRFIQVRASETDVRTVIGDQTFELKGAQPAIQVLNSPWCRG